MSIRGKRDYLSGLGGSFTEDAPRPPVPGEEGELVCSEERQCSNLSFSSRNETLKCDASVATPRRPDLDLGYEPEGSASPTPPFLKWAESLHSLLDDQDGIHLFRMFLKQEDCTDMLDFWFACSGFRKLEANESNDEKKGKLAKAIYKKFILDTNGIVSRQIKPATKSFIRDSLMKLTIDPAMFDQAQTEIQTIMEDNTYPLFLKSDIYLEYTQTGGESPKPLSDQSSVSGDGKELSGYLPTLNEDEEWRCEHESEEQLKDDPTAGNQLTQRFLMETAPQSITSGTRDRHAPCRETLTPYHVNTGYTIAVPTSTNDSEQQSMSSDADTVSLTDSSLDGMPPCTQRKQHRREMQESAKANGRLPLPHIPRTSRIPKDIHVEPERFAAQLISRLEAVQLEREAQDKLEERLKRVRLEENGEEAMTSTATGLSGHRFPSAVYPQNYNSRCADITHTIALLRDAHDENPESILDDHVQRVMKTPGCLSPRAGWRSPRSCSPDRFPAGKATGPGKYLSSSQGKHPSRHPGLKGESSHHHQHKHVHHIHHAGSGKPREQAETEATVRVQSRSSADGMGSNPLEHPSIKGKREYRKFESARPYDTTGNGEEVEKNQKILLWLMEGEKEMVQHKKSPYGSTTGSKRITGHESFRHSSVDRCGSVYPCVSSTQLRNDVQPSHPFIQDPTMPPNPAPSPLIQLEEVCRRLEEQTMKSRVLQTKQKYVMEVIQRGRSAARPKVFPPLNVVPAVSDSELSEPEHKGTKKPPCENTVVAYYFCEEQIPYRTSVKERVVTLGQFKELLTKKGNYRYYFKKVSDEFDCGVVFEEVREDDATLPIFDEKIVGKVEKIE